MRLIGKALTIFACLFGIYVSIGLIGIHLDAEVGNIAGAAARCGSGGGCGEAAQSVYSTLLGVPIAAIGFAFYVSTLVVTGYSMVSQESPDREGGLSDAVGMIFAFFVLASLYSVFLAWANYTQLSTSCSECSKLYAINALGLLGSAIWLGVEGLKRCPRRLVRHPTQLHFWVFLVTFAVALGGSIWFVHKEKTSASEDVQQREKSDSASVDSLLGPEVSDDALLVDGHAASWGDEDAAVTLVEFSDFQCPYCARFAETVTELKNQFRADELRVVFRNFPLQMHPRAKVAARGAVCAQDAGKFWAFHDRLFANQHRMSDDDLKTLATAVGLDPVMFANCVDSDFAESRVADDRAAGEALGIQGTPTIFLNGRPYNGSLDASNISRVVRLLNENAKNPPETEATDADVWIQPEQDAPPVEEGAAN